MTTIRRAVAGAAVIGLSVASLTLLADQAQAKPGDAPTADQCVTVAEARSALIGQELRTFVDRVAPDRQPGRTIRYQAARVRDVMACRWHTDVMRVRLAKHPNVINGWRYLRYDAQGHASVVASSGKADKDTPRYLDTDSHGVLQGTNMPKCSDDLGRPCVVYITQDGMPDNSYWLDASGSKHWFWSEDPVQGNRPPNHWLDEYGTTMTDAMAANYPSQANRNWGRCWFALIPGEPADANCPDGSAWAI